MIKTTLVVCLTVQLFGEFRDGLSDSFVVSNELVIYYSISRECETSRCKSKSAGRRKYRRCYWSCLCHSRNCSRCCWYCHWWVKLYTDCLAILWQTIVFWCNIVQTLGVVVDTSNAVIDVAHNANGIIKNATSNIVGVGAAANLEAQKALANLAAAVEALQRNGQITVGGGGALAPAPVAVPGVVPGAPAPAIAPLAPGALAPVAPAPGAPAAPAPAATGGVAAAPGVSAGGSAAAAGAAGVTTTTTTAASSTTTTAKP